MRRDLDSARQQAKWLLGWFGVSTVPVDPARLADFLGIQVRDTLLDQDISGALIKEGGQDPTIALNQEDSPDRRRWACARQLGHFMGLRADRDEYRFVDRRSTADHDDYAEAFAAALLIPGPGPRAKEPELALECNVPPEKLASGSVR